MAEEILDSVCNIKIIEGNEIPAHCIKLHKA